MVTVTDVNKVRESQEGEAALIAVARSRRIESDYKDLSCLFDMEPYKCDAQTFLGLPLIDAPCVFAPGKEDRTCREYLRYENDLLKTFNPYTFPGDDRGESWPGSNWSARAMDNKFPMADEGVPMTENGIPIEGVRYRPEYIINDGFVTDRHAVGKDYIILLSPFHIFAPRSIDHFKNLQLAQLLTERELRKGQQYVVIGRNSPGLPVKKKEPFSGREYYTFEDSKQLGAASRVHPHDRVVSLRVLPDYMQNSYEKVENRSRENGNAWLYQPLIESDDLTIKKGKYFVLLANPVPKHNGGLVIAARSARNILELDDGQLKELGDTMKYAEELIDMMFGFPPFTVYFKQIFVRDYPHYVLNVRFEPRGPNNGVPGFFEYGTGISGITLEPKEVKYRAESLRKWYGERSK